MWILITDNNGADTRSSPFNVRRSSRSLKISAAKPTMCGHAIDVPSIEAYLLIPVGTVETIATRRAKSTSSPKEVKFATKNVLACLYAHWWYGYADYPLGMFPAARLQTAGRIP